MTTLREIVTKFGFKADKGQLQGVQNGIKHTKDGLKQATAGAKQFTNQLSKGLGFLKVAAGAWLARAGVRGLTSDFADQADIAAKQSQAMGISVEQYQSLKHAAELSGTSIEELQTGMGKLGKKARDASMGVKASKEAFDELHINIKKADGSLKNQDELLYELADKFSTMPDGATKTALAMEVMGKSGARMIPMLNAGSAGIKEMQQEAKELGIVLDRESLATAEAYGDSMLRLKSVVTGLRNQIALKLLPALTGAAEGFTHWYRRGKNAAFMLSGLKIIAASTAAVLMMFGAVKMAKGWKVLHGWIKSGITWMKSFERASLAANVKAMLPVVALALLIALVEDLVGFAQGKDSIIGRLLGDGKDADELRASLLSLGADMKVTWEEIKPLLQDALKGAIELLPTLAKGLAYAAFGVVKAIKFIVDVLRYLGYGIGVFSAQVYLFFVAVIEWVTNVNRAFDEWWASVIDGASKAIGAVVKFFKDLGATITKWWDEFAAFVDTGVAGIVEIWDKGGELIKNVWTDIKTFVMEIIDWIADAGSKIGDGIASGIEGMMNTLRGIIKALPSTVQDMLPDGLMEFAIGDGPTAASQLGGTISDRVSAIGGVGGTNETRIANSIKTGDIKVNIQSAPDMTAPEMQTAIKEGTKQALEEHITSTYRDFAEVPT